MEKSFFAYHLTHFFGAFGMESYHTNSDKPTEGDVVYVISGDDADEGGKDYALEGLFRIYRKHSGPFLLKSLKGDAREFKYRLSLIPVRMPPSPIEMREMGWYERKEIHNYFSSGQNFNPVPSKYKERFDQLLVQFGGGTDNTAADLQTINNRSDIPLTTSDALVQARVGQGKFRTDVTNLWGKGEVCALTGIDVPELLIASHIQPWRDSSDAERLDACNGLLLATHVDKAFDKYLLSFSESRGDFFASMHPRVVAALRKTGVTPTMKLTTSHMNLSDGRRFSRYIGEHYRKHMAQIKVDQPTGAS
jgi:HNH endonuclease